MYILNPDPYLLPSYRISPFTTNDIAFNSKLPDGDSINDYIDERFKGRQYLFTHNGREALNIALFYFNLQKDDIVTILTTSGNFYISSCVTNEIEKFCKWSRQIEEDTKAILVNHEFGYPYLDLLYLKEKGLPIIEDCAHSFFSKDKENTIGKIGDFVIYSFPKIFPLQIGGLLLSNFLNDIAKIRPMDDLKLRYLKNVLSHHIKSEDKIINKRIINYNFLKEKFTSLGFADRFTLSQGIVPGVFMFKSNGHKVNLPELKKYFYAHGVQCSVFYGEESFFIPVHQALEEQDMLYFYEVMKSFIQRTEA